MGRSLLVVGVRAPNGTRLRRRSPVRARRVAPGPRLGYTGPTRQGIALQAAAAWPAVLPEIIHDRPVPAAIAFGRCDRGARQPRRQPVPRRPGLRSAARPLP